MIEGIPLWLIGMAITSLGSPGLVLVFWFVDHRRYDREQKERDAQRATENAAWEKRFESVVRMYENNSLLVTGYERLAGELAGIIHLNTQVQTKLVERINNNMFCPVVRNKGPNNE